jgi:hypothetical protein
MMMITLLAMVHVIIKIRIQINIHLAATQQRAIAKMIQEVLVLIAVSKTLYYYTASDLNYVINPNDFVVLNCYF